MQPPFMCGLWYKLEFNEQLINGVIASQSADWRGNPLRKKRKTGRKRVKTFGDCHTSDIGHWFAMTSSFGSIN